MAFVYELIVLVHLIGMAGVVGGYLAHIKAPKLAPIVVHSALTQVVTGLILVGMLEAIDGLAEDGVNHMKVGIKLLVALVIAVLAWTNRNKDLVPARVFHAIGGLALLNVAVAVLL